MRLRIVGKELIFFIAISAGLSVFLLFATSEVISFWRSYEGTWTETPTYYKFLTFLNLADEDVVASWFSSMLLAAIAWLAVMCFLLDRKRPGPHWLDYGWALISLIFAALSFDELGSLHERVRLPGRSGGNWLWYAPIVALLPLYLGLFAFFRMRKDKLALVLVFLGGLAFASIPIQEHFEVGVERGAAWQRPVSHFLLEEGAELAAMLVILIAFVRYVLNFMREERAGGGEAVEIEIRPWVVVIWSLAIFGLGVLAGEIATMSLQPDDLSGTPRHWFPAWASFSAGCLAWLRPERTLSARGFALGQLAAVCVTASILVGASLHTFEPLVLAFSAWLAVAWLFAAIMLRSRIWIIGSVLWAGTLIASFNLLPGWAAPFGLVSSSLFLVLTLIAYGNDEHNVEHVLSRGTALPRTRT